MAKFDLGTPVKLLGGEKLMTVIENSEQRQEAKCSWHDDTDRIAWIPEGILRNAYDELPSS
jgi:hypothetical protein